MKWKSYKSVNTYERWCHILREKDLKFIEGVGDEK